MTGIMRNLFGTYKLYDTPDYEDLIPKFLWAEKWGIYGAACLATYDIVLSPEKSKGALQVAGRVLRYVKPVAAAAGTFVGVLYASAHLRGKKNDEWNSFNATLVSGMVFNQIVKGPWIYFGYFVLVGFSTNVYKQCELYNWTLYDEESQQKRREIGLITGPFLVDWTLLKEFPPKWVNGDELDAQQAKGGRL